MDKLEKFMIENREVFDDMAPDPKVWKELQKDITPPRKIHWRSISLRVAAVAAIFIMSYFIHDFIDNEQDVKPAGAARGLDPQNAKEIQNLVETQAFYSSKIEYKKEEVFRLAGGNKSLVSDINTEFNELDKALGDLKQDLQDNASNEEVVEAMIQNYRLKLMILEEMLMQLKASQKSDENEKDESYEI